MRHILIIFAFCSLLFAQPTITTEYLVDGSFDGATSVYATDMDGDGDVDIIGAAENGDDPELAAENGTGSQGLSSQAAEQVLPRSITFVGSEIEMDARDIFAGEQAMADGQAMPGDMSTSWSSPILFYPDGSASQTKLQLTDSKATRFVIVSLRGMTGLSQATDIITQQDTMDLEAEDLGP